MEIHNKNIFSNLNAGEEIVYIAQKDKFSFWSSLIAITFFALPILAFLDLVSIFKYNIFGTVWLQIFMIIVLLFFCYITYLIIVNYCVTDIILTNQRVIFSNFNKINSISNSEISFISGTYGFNGSAKSTTIHLKNKKSYNFLFVNKDIIIKYLKELPNGYNDSEIVAKNKKNAMIILIILLISMPITFYFEMKLIKPSSNSQNSINSTSSKKASKSKKSSYFDSYIEKIQVKIKKNWQPPEKAKKSKIVVLFKIMKDGTVKDLKIIKSSNNSDLDASAMNAVLLAAPFDPLPTQCTENSVDINFTFDLNTVVVKDK